MRVLFCREILKESPYLQRRCYLTLREAYKGTVCVKIAHVKICPVTLQMQLRELLLCHCQA